MWNSVILLQSIPPKSTRLEELNLGISRGQDGGRFALALDGLDEIIVHGLGDIRCHVGFSGINTDG